jgi:hypothetical protein
MREGDSEDCSVCELKFEKVAGDFVPAKTSPGAVSLGKTGAIVSRRLFKSTIRVGDATDLLRSMTALSDRPADTSSDGASCAGCVPDGQFVKRILSDNGR